MFYFYKILYSHFEAPRNVEKLSELIFPGVFLQTMNLEALTLKNWNFAAFRNILLETFVPNLVFLTRPILQILGKSKAWVFLISGFLVNPSRTSADIDIILGPVTKIDKRNNTVIFPIYGQFGAIWKQN